MKKAIIFDLDGTMFDTEKVSKEAFKHVASQINIELDDEFFNNIMGTTYNSICEYLKRIPELLEVFPQVAKVWEEMIIERTYEKDALNKNGLIDLLDYLNENGHKIAVASSSNINHINRLINHISKSYHFNTIVPGTSIKNSKPAPDIFLKAANEMNVLPQDCIVIEDSVNGVRAAKAANMTSIFIEDVVKFKKEDYQYVDYECSDLKDVINILKNVSK